MNEKDYTSVRDPNVLGPIIGARVVDVTQHDQEDFQEDGSRVFLHFDNGYTVTFRIGEDGFDVEGGDSDEDGGDA